MFCLLAAHSSVTGLGTGRTQLGRSQHTLNCSFQAEFLPSWGGGGNTYVCIEGIVGLSLGQPVGQRSHDAHTPLQPLKQSKAPSAAHGMSPHLNPWHQQHPQLPAGGDEGLHRRSSMHGSGLEILC